MTTQNSEYYIHSGNTDILGDPITGISRVDTHVSGLLLPRALASVELTDIPQPLKTGGIISPTDEEVRKYGGFEPETANSDATVSFIDWYGVGEPADLEQVSVTVAEFIINAIERARRFNLNVLNELSEREHEALQDDVTVHIRRASSANTSGEEYPLGIGMYL